MATVANVTAAKAKVGGACYIAAKGTTLPTDATTALGSGFTNLGYISEDGLTNTDSPSSEVVKDWNGDIVLTINKGREDKFKFKLIEATNSDVLKVIYGDDNVTVDSTSSDITVHATSEDLEERVFVFELVIRDGKRKRIVVPLGTVASVGDITYSASAAVAYEVEVNCAPDSSGYTHTEYIEA